MTDILTPSPYASASEDDWPRITRELVDQHPLSTEELVDIVGVAWSAIFDSRLGGKFRIGHEIKPKPQIMGFLLHELISLELSSRKPAEWRGERFKYDKDLVYIPDDNFSFELKTSSHSSQVFGNRSFAQPQQEGAKRKDGYYLAVNFGKFSGSDLPRIARIRFGWLDHTDWIAQTSATGQQARLNSVSERSKLIIIGP